MSFIRYGGVKYSQVRHAIYCKLCKDTLESKRGFKICSCGSAGIDENRILGSLEHIEQRSMYCAFINGKKFWLPEEITHLNLLNNYNQNDKVQGREAQGNDYTSKEAT